MSARQDRSDRCLVIASVLAVGGVNLQGHHLSTLLDGLGFAAAAASWVIFAAVTVRTLRVVPDRAAWARSHAFELVVLIVAFPLWPLLFRDLMVLQLSPALTVLEATKLAKLAKVVRTVRRRDGGRVGSRVLAATVIGTAAWTAGQVVWPS